MRDTPSTRSLPILLAAVTAAALYAGCSTGDPAHPSLGAAVTATPGPPIGPSPLRRLSDNEYLNALHDLFPTLSPTLPALPPDIPVAGFENAAEAQEPSDVLIARFETIANLYAAAATVDAATVAIMVGCTDWSTPAATTACAGQFIDQVGGRIFRRPLDANEHDRFLTRFQGWAAAVDFPAAVQLTLSTMLQSPQFLYRPEPLAATLRPGSAVPAAPYAMATRLSFFLWESVPDDTLLAAASRGELGTDDQIRAQSARMLADERALRVLWSFPRQWLGLDQILLAESAARTPQVDPQWTTTTQASAFTETQLFVQNVLSQGGTLPDLLTSSRAWVDGEMARVYGLPAPADPTAWTEVTLPSTERAGLLTRVSFLASNSHPGATSPPVRGNAIQLRLLCELPISPPAGVNLSQPMVPPGSGPETNRTLFELRTSPAFCQTCHAGLNGFGFGFEEYDAAGHYQTTDDTLPVDATGTITGTDVNGPYDGAIDLSQKLSHSEVVHDCATQELVRYALGRAPVDVEGPNVDALAKSFLASGGDLRALLGAIVLTPSFRMELVGRNDVRLNRRQLLQAVGLGAASCILRGEPVARAGGTTFPTRIVFYVQPHGHIPNAWRMNIPGGATDQFAALPIANMAASDLSPTLQPLYAYRDRLLAIEGLSHTSALADIEAVTRAGTGDLNNHQVGVADVLTGTRALQRPGTYCTGGAATIDQVLAARLSAPGRFDSRVYGFDYIPNSVISPFSYLGPGQATPMVSDPAAAFSDLLGYVKPAASSSSSRASLIASLRPSVLDAVAQEYDLLAPKLGAAGKQKLDAHRDLVRQLETSLGAIGTTSTCNTTFDGTPATTSAASIHQFMDLIRMAFACDLTRIVTFSAPVPQCPELGYPGDVTFHEYAHQSIDGATSCGQTFNPIAAQAMTDLDAWHAGHVAYLCAQLDSVPEGSGTVLDHTVVVWITELATPTHLHYDAFTVLVGGANGFFAPGRYVRYPQTMTSPMASQPLIGPAHNQLLVSLMQAMGQTDTTFGMTGTTAIDGSALSFTGGLVELQKA